MSSKIPLIVILGPTASGKTSLSLNLADKFDGEIISADSRQIYKYMNIGTAKEPGKWKKYGREKVYMVENIPHYLIDFLEPDEEYSAAMFKKETEKRIKEIASRGKLPFLVGGTALYIDAVVDNLPMSKVKPDSELRKNFEAKNNKELFKMLKEFDPEAAEQIDIKNKRRIIRALEVFILSGQKFSAGQKKGKRQFEVLKLGITRPREELYDRINKRVDIQMKEGLLDEVKSLVKKGYGWGLTSMSGIGYKQMGYFLRGEKTLDEAIEILKRDTRHYARRQLIWWRKDQEINWVKNLREAKKSVDIFLGK